MRVKGVKRVWTVPCGGEELRWRVEPKRNAQDLFWLFWSIWAMVMQAKVSTPSQQNGGTLGVRVR